MFVIYVIYVYVCDKRDIYEYVICTIYMIYM